MSPSPSPAARGSLSRLSLPRPSPAGGSPAEWVALPAAEQRSEPTPMEGELVTVEGLARDLRRSYHQFYRLCDFLHKQERKQVRKSDAPPPARTKWVPYEHPICKHGGLNLLFTGPWALIAPTILWTGRAPESWLGAAIAWGLTRFSDLPQRVTDWRLPNDSFRPLRCSPQVYRRARKKFDQPVQDMVALYKQIDHEVVRHAADSPAREGLLWLKHRTGAYLHWFVVSNLPSPRLPRHGSCASERDTRLEQHERDMCAFRCLYWILFAAGFVYLCLLSRGPHLSICVGLGVDLARHLVRADRRRSALLVMPTAGHSTRVLSNFAPRALHIDGVRITPREVRKLPVEAERAGAT